MNMGYQRLHCCGLVEIVGLNTGKIFKPAEIFKYICQNHGYSDKINLSRPDKLTAGRAAFIMSCAYWDEADTNPHDMQNVTTKAECDRRTQILKEYIEKFSLGTLIVVPDNGNPRYSNTHIIRTLVFVPNQMNMLTHCKKKKWKNLDIDSYYWL